MQVAIQHGIPIGPLSKVYVVDPVNGASGNSGLSFESPLNTVEAAYALMTASRHDTFTQIAWRRTRKPRGAKLGMTTARFATLMVLMLHHVS